MIAQRGKGVAAFGRPPATEAGRTRSSRADRLASDAAEAAQVRQYLAHPDVVALRVERVRAQVDRMCWAGIVLGLAFTMTNVQTFAAAGAPAWSAPWLAAWLLDPTVSLVLLAILRAEQVTARYQVRTGPWVRRAKWLTLGATYVMNTWSAFTAGSAAMVVLHSVPPLVVFVAAEAITDLRDRLTEAAFVAASMSPGGGRETAQIGDLSEFTEDEAAGRRARSRRPAKASRRRRKLLADYLVEARSAWSPGVVVTPAWVRAATGCSRGLSPRLAAALNAELGGSCDGARP